MYPENETAAGTFAVANPAAAVTITCGFSPRYVKAININDLATHEYFYGLAAGASIQTITDGTISVNAADGITVSETGFTLGTDICDTAADVVRYIAFR